MVSRHEVNQAGKLMRTEVYKNKQESPALSVIVNFCFHQFSSSVYCMLPQLTPWVSENASLDAYEKGSEVK